MIASGAGVDQDLHAGHGGEIALGRRGSVRAGDGDELHGLVGRLWEVMGERMGGTRNEDRTGGSTFRLFGMLRLGRSCCMFQSCGLA